MNEFSGIAFEPNYQSQAQESVMRKGNKAEYINAIFDQLKDIWIEEHHLPSTYDKVLFA